MGDKERSTLEHREGFTKWFDQNWTEAVPLSIWHSLIPILLRFFAEQYYLPIFAVFGEVVILITKNNIDLGDLDMTGSSVSFEEDWEAHLRDVDDLNLDLRMVDFTWTSDEEDDDDDDISSDDDQAFIVRALQVRLCFDY